MPRGKRTNDFFDDDCGQNALQLASRGSALIAELLRLSEHIPSEFRTPELHKENEKIICDFTYFKTRDAFEKVIQDSAALLQRDDDFRETHGELLDRFFKLFRGVLGYIVELNRFVEEIKEGLYISQTLESVLIHPDGKQLMCEIYYLMGVMLLLLDQKIPGKTREYLIVSYVRYRGAGEQQTVEVARMFRSTGLMPGKEPPPRYPEEYFGRANDLDREVLGMLIGRIRSDDLYQMLYNFPAPEHRSAALSTQSAMVYVLLFFMPRYLDDKPVMREIVDKHFADTWEIAFYMGFTVKLSDAWKGFKGAKAAIATTTDKENVEHRRAYLAEVVHKTNDKLASLLREGVLTEQFVLDRIHSELIPIVRDANVCLRWFILHRGQLDVKAKDGALTVTTDDLLTLLLRISQLEFSLKSMFQFLLKEKRVRWDAAKASGAAKMNKLSTYYSGEHVLSDNVKVAQLETWFSDIAERIESLSYNDSVSAGRKIQKLIKALENVEEFHHIDSNLQVIQFLNDTRQLLRNMIRIINIETKVLVTMATVGDLSYAWERFATERCFVKEIQDKIRDQPKLTLQMRSAFVKMSSMMELPCARIDQACQNDPTLEVTLEAVSEYYSSQLVVFVREVLHVIPLTIFQNLSKIAHILKKDLSQCPTKINRREMKDHGQLEVRQKLAFLTSQIAEFASGVLAMESTLVGVIQVDPHKLLEDGIRRELTKQVAIILNDFLNVEDKAAEKKGSVSATDFDAKLQSLARDLSGVRQSFEYIQDFVDMHGLRIWLEEFSRIVNFNVEMECNMFLPKIYPWKSRYFSEGIPTRFYENAMRDRGPVNFLGRLMHHVLDMTRPTRSIYVPTLGAWFDSTTREMVVGDRTFKSISAAIGCQGMAALDRLLCFKAAHYCQIVIKAIRARVEGREDFLPKCRVELLPSTGSAPADNFVDAAVYEMIANLFQKSAYQETLKIIDIIGRIQLVRNCIASELRSETKLNSSSLFSALKTCNECLIADLERHYTDPVANPMPGSIIPELTPYLESIGVGQAQAKVYTTAKPLGELPFVLASFATRSLAGWVYDTNLSCLRPKEKVDTPIDAVALCYGIVTLLKQFHSGQKTLFFGLLFRYVRSLVRTWKHDTKKNHAQAVPDEAQLMVRLLEVFADTGSINLTDLHRVIPAGFLFEVNLNAPIYQPG